MSFNRQAERQVSAAIQAILTSASNATRKELETLRAEFEARLSALQPRVDDAEWSALVNGVVEDLSRAASAEAEQMAVAARQETEEAAAQRLAAAQGAIEIQLERERAETAALRETVDDLQTRLHEMATAAKAEITAARDDAATARREVHDTIELLRAAESRLHESEEAREQVQRALHDSDTRLESETRERTALAQSIDAAREAIEAARAETEASSQELAEARTQVEAWQQTVERSIVAPLARLRGALREFTALAQARKVLDTFAEHFGHEFDRSALFVSRGNRLEGWRSCGPDATADIRKLAVPLAMESPVTRAFSEATSIVVAAGEEGPRSGLLGHDAHGALAVPILVRRRVIAVAYAEWTHEVPVECQHVGMLIGEVLADHASMALTRLSQPSRRPAPKPTAVIRGTEAPRQPAAGEPSRAAARPLSFPGPQRAANRVRFPNSLEVLVDGETALLVDISTLGAQVICNKAMRPNRAVRVLLPHNDGVLCQGNVVWALFELAPSGGRYRAGVKFSAADPTSIEHFLNQEITKQPRSA